MGILKPIKTKGAPNAPTGSWVSPVKYPCPNCNLFHKTLPAVEKCLKQAHFKLAVMEEYKTQFEENSK